MTDNATDSRDDFIRLRAEVEALGRDELVHRAIERGDPESLCGLIEVLQLTSSEAVDLIVAFGALRYFRADAAAIDTWKRRAAVFLLRHIGETPEAERELAN
jgi:hypothetical protein